MQRRVALGPDEHTRALARRPGALGPDRPRELAEAAHGGGVAEVDAFDPAVAIGGGQRELADAARGGDEVAGMAATRPDWAECIVDCGTNSWAGLGDRRRVN